MYNVQLIYGPKGCGKTKKLVDMANDSVKDAKGVLVYIDKDNSRMHDLDHAIKLVDASEYDVRCEKAFVAFIKGLLAGNYDIQKIYFDGIIKIVKKPLEELQGMFESLAELTNKFDVEFVFTFSVQNELPEFLAKYNTLCKF